MTRRRCARCDSKGARWRWDFHACADGRRKRSRWLCDACDIAANTWLLTFFRVPDAKIKLEKYKP